MNKIEAYRRPLEATDTASIGRYFLDEHAFITHEFPLFMTAVTRHEFPLLKASVSCHELAIEYGKFNFEFISHDGCIDSRQPWDPYIRSASDHCLTHRKREELPSFENRGSILCQLLGLDLKLRQAIDLQFSDQLLLSLVDCVFG